jgi:hypothetical protein
MKSRYFGHTASLDQLSRSLTPLLESKCYRPQIWLWKLVEGKKPRSIEFDDRLLTCIEGHSEYICNVYYMQHASESSTFICGADMRLSLYPDLEHTES